MAFEFSETDEELVYHEQVSALLRIFIGAVGVILLAASLVFIELIRGMGEADLAARIGGIAAACLGFIAFILFGGFCLKLAFFMPARTIIFDKQRHYVTCRNRSPARSHHAYGFPFADIVELRVVEQVSEDSGSSFSVALDLLGRDAMELGVFNSRGEAEDRMALLRDMTASPAVGRRPKTTDI